MAALRLRHVIGPASLLASGMMTGPALADDSQLWAVTRVSAQVAPRVLIGNEMVFRASDQRGYYDFVDHVTIGYAIDPHMTAWIGYTRQTGMSHGRRLAVEQRLRQQINVEDMARIGPVRLGGRLRLEQRWRDGQSETGWRLRPQEKLSLPLPGTITVTISHEDFVNLNATRFQTADGEERMRNAIAIAFPVSSHVTAEIGYMQQHFFAITGMDPDANVVTLLLAANF